MVFDIFTGEGELTTKLIRFVLLIIVMLISFSFHEWAHAHAAYRNGDMTARNMGRMTLNPIAHIDPIGFLLLMFAGFGWAKPVPVNPANYKSYRKAEFQVSFAGIFTNLMIALVSAFLYIAFEVAEILGGFEFPVLAYYFLNLLGIINVSLAVFNFIPVFPLDGSHIFELLLGRKFPKAMLWMHNNGRFILLGIFILSYILGKFGFSPLGTVTYWIYSKFLQLFAFFGNLIVG